MDGGLAMMVWYFLCFTMELISEMWEIDSGFVVPFVLVGYDVSPLL